MSYNLFDFSDDFQGSESESLRLPSLPRRHRVVERLMSEAILDPQIAKYRDRAQYTFFCGEEPRQLGGYEGQLEVVGRCLEWFVFDCEIPEYGETPGQHWFSNHAEELPEEDRIVADDCLNFILSIFEITEVSPGEGFTVVDLLRPQHSYRINEQVVSEETREGQLLLSRIFPQGEGYTLSGMAVLMNETATSEIKRFILDGRLNPKLILPTLDGVEMENLFGRSLKNLSTKEELTVLEGLLRKYFNEINPCELSYNELQKLLLTTEDPMDLLARIDEEVGFFNRHETDLIFTMVLTVWDQMHST